MEVRTLFLSDCHLGSKYAQTAILNKFLKNIKPAALYLVGDIIDGWRFNRKWKWGWEENKFIRRIIKMSQKILVRYVAGNHDEFLRGILPIKFGDIEVANRFDHFTKSGKAYLVTHGDFFDVKTKDFSTLYRAGDLSYQFILFLNGWANYIRTKLKLGRWSLARAVKTKLKQAVNYINTYEQVLVREAKSNTYDGVICGHIHKPENRMIDGVHYLNCGDWVEHCSAVVEHYDGTFEVIYYDA